MNCIRTPRNPAIRTSSIESTVLRGIAVSPAFVNAGEFLNATDLDEPSRVRLRS